MRRDPAEWLLTPLFLLPLVVVATFVFLARQSYVGELERFRQDGARLLEQCLAYEPGSEALRSLFLEGFAPGSDDREELELAMESSGAIWHERRVG